MSDDYKALVGKLIGVIKRYRSPMGCREANEIGRQLNELGGFQMMLRAHDQVQKTLGSVAARELEAEWGGIGDWER